MEMKVQNIKLDLLDQAVRRRPVPVAVFCVFDDEYFHREAILVLEDEQEKEAA